MKQPDVLGRYPIIGALTPAGKIPSFLAWQRGPGFKRQVVVLLMGHTPDPSGDFFQPDHPAVAALLDAGVCDRYGAFLVFEYVAADPLETYFVWRKPAFRDRMRLYIELCRAVHQAHQESCYLDSLSPHLIKIRPDGRLKLACYFRKQPGPLKTPSASKWNPSLVEKDIRKLKNLLPAFFGGDTGCLFKSQLISFDFPNEDPVASVLDYSKRVQTLGTKLRPTNMDSPAYERFFRWPFAPKFLWLPVVVLLVGFFPGLTKINTSSKAENQRSANLAASEKSFHLLLEILQSSDPTIARGEKDIPAGLWAQYQIMKGNGLTAEPVAAAQPSNIYHFQQLHRLQNGDANPRVIPESRLEREK